MGVGQALQLQLLDAVFGGGASQSAYTGQATTYCGVSTSTYTTSLLDATIVAAEPANATGSYARITITNNSTNYPASTNSTATGTKKLHVSFSFAASTAAWSTGATALASFFMSATSTPQAGTPLWMGALSPATDIVNGAGVTFTFAIDALQFTLAPA